MLTEFGNSTRKWPEILSPNKLNRFSKKGTRFPKINKKRDKGRQKKNWYFWVVPTTKWRPPPSPSCGQGTNFFVEKFFFCLESPETGKKFIRLESDIFTPL